MSCGKYHLLEVQSLANIIDLHDLQPPPPPPPPPPRIVDGRRVSTAGGDGDMSRGYESLLLTTEEETAERCRWGGNGRGMGYFINSE